MQQKKYSIFLMVSAIAIALALELYLFEHTVDDAYISFRYARNFAEGYGINWNKGEDLVEGYSNILWVLLCAAFIKARLDVVLWAKISGMIFSLANLVLLRALTKFFLPEPLKAIIPSLLLSLTPFYALWAVSGLETQMFLFWLLLAVYFLIEEERGKSSVLSALFFAFLALTRTEGAALFAAVAVLRGAKNLWVRERKRRVWEQYIAWLALFAFIYVPYFIWRVWYYGYLFPNPVYRKRVILEGVSYVLEFLIYESPFLLFSLFALIRRKLGFAHLVLVVLFIAQLLIVINVNPVMGYGARFLLPVLPFLFVLAGETVGYLLDTATSRRGLWIPITVLALAFLAFYPLKDLAVTKASVQKSYNNFQAVYIALGQWLHEEFPPTASIAVFDAGAIPYYSQLRAIDIWGLNDEYITHNGFSAEYVLSQKPDLVVLATFVGEGCVPVFLEDAAISEHSAFRDNYEFIKVFKGFQYSFCVYRRRE